jgi:hypothetical protein
MLARNKTAPSQSTRKTTAQASRLQTAPIPASTQRPVKISDRLEKRINPNAKPTAFSLAYQKGMIPCRLIHGSVNHKLGWSVPPSQLNFDPILITFFDGLVDTRHPYEFLVRAGLADLLSSDGASQKVHLYLSLFTKKIAPIIAAITRPLRAGLGATEKSVLAVSLAVLAQLARVVGAGVLVILASVLPPLAAKLHNCDARIGMCARARGLLMDVANEILNTLRAIETAVVEAGSKEEGRRVLKILKQKVPTYSSVYF